MSDIEKIEDTGKEVCSLYDYLDLAVGALGTLDHVQRRFNKLSAELGECLDEYAGAVETEVIEAECRNLSGTVHEVISGMATASSFLEDLIARIKAESEKALHQ